MSTNQQIAEAILKEIDGAGNVTSLTSLDRKSVV